MDIYLISHSMDYSHARGGIKAIVITDVIIPALILVPTLYQDGGNTPGALPRYHVHSLKLLWFWGKEWVSNNHTPTPNIAWSSLANKNFQHWCVTTSYFCYVITYTYNVPTKHHHQEPSSGETLQEAPSCIILTLTALNSLLQYVNWLVWEVCSVNCMLQNKEAWLQLSKLAKMLCMGHTEFGAN